MKTLFYKLILIFVFGAIVLIFSPKDTQAARINDINTSYTAGGIKVQVGSDNLTRMLIKTTSGNLSYVVCSDVDCTSKTSQIITASPTIGEDFVLGSDNFGRIVYQITNQILFVRCTNNDCSTRTSPQVISGVSTQWNDTVGIVLTSAGLPRIIYETASPAQLYIAHCSNVDCTGVITPFFLTSSGSSLPYPDIAVGPTGDIHIAVHYWNGGVVYTGGIRYIFCNPGCSVNNVYTFNDHFRVTLGLKVSSTNLGKFTFTMGSNTNNYYLSCTITTCLTNTVVSFNPANDGYVTDIIIQGSVPMIAFTQEFGAGVTNMRQSLIRCADLNCSSHTIIRIDPRYRSGGFNIGGIALDTSNNARLVYNAYEVGSGGSLGRIDLRHARCTTTNCDVTATLGVKMFIDNGAGGGTANDGIKQAGESWLTDPAVISNFSIGSHFFHHNPPYDELTITDTSTLVVSNLTVLVNPVVLAVTIPAPYIPTRYDLNWDASGTLAFPAGVGTYTASTGSGFGGGSVYYQMTIGLTTGNVTNFQVINDKDNDTNVDSGEAFAGDFNSNVATIAVNPTSDPAGTFYNISVSSNGNGSYAIAGTQSFIRVTPDISAGAPYWKVGKHRLYSCTPNGNPYTFLGPNWNSAGRTSRVDPFFVQPTCPKLANLVLGLNDIDYDIMTNNRIFGSADPTADPATVDSLGAGEALVTVAYTNGWPQIDNALNTQVDLSVTSCSGPVACTPNSFSVDTASVWNPNPAFYGTSAQMNGQISFINQSTLTIQGNGMPEGTYTLNIRGVLNEYDPQDYSSFPAKTGQVRIFVTNFPWISSSGGDVGSLSGISMTSWPKGNLTTTQLNASGYAELNQCGSQAWAQNSPNNGRVTKSSPISGGCTGNYENVQFISFNLPPGDGQVVRTARMIIEGSNGAVTAQGTIHIQSSNWGPTLEPSDINLPANTNDTFSAVAALAPGGYTSVNLDVGYINNSGGTVYYRLRSASNPAELKICCGDGDNVRLEVTYVDGVNSSYLVIANEAVSQFKSAKNWLVENYLDENNLSETGLNISYENIYEDLWNQSGKTNAVSWFPTGECPLGPSSPCTSAELPPNGGVYAFPSTDQSVTTEMTLDAAGIITSNGDSDADLTDDAMVVFFNGDLHINKSVDARGGRTLIFIVEGNVIVDETVDTIDAYIIANGEFNSGENTVPLPRSASNVGNGISIAKDSAGLAAIAYYDISNTNLKVLRCENLSCSGQNTINTVDGCPSCHINGTVGFEPTMEIAGDDNPMIVYEGSGNRVVFARCNDAACAGQNETYQVIATTVSSPVIGDMELFYGSGFCAVIGCPVFTYSDSGSDLYIVRCLEPTCSLRGSYNLQTDFPNSQAYWSTLELDSSNNPVVAFYGSRDGTVDFCDLSTACQVVIARCITVQCTGSPAATATNFETSDGVLPLVNRQPTIDLKLAPNPVVAYYDQADNLSLAFCSAMDCASHTSRPVESNSAIDTYQPSLRLDSNGYPMLSFTSRNGGTNPLELRALVCQSAACNSGETPVTVFAQPITDYGRYNSMVLNNSENMMIAYSNTTQQDLMFTSCTNHSCTNRKTLAVDGNATSGSCAGCKLTVNGGVVAEEIILGRDVGQASVDTPSEDFNFNPAILHIFASEELLGSIGKVYREANP